ncbi:MAG: CoB--CoM heterodisulfide reductase iron-sulfur subunit A family protein [Deltaproteobacteria bacterium]|nr:CoB--CoM heterodisulfide reductase iron-sulfur subunit A family protein [Deltaproteobacteria bacterium]
MATESRKNNAIGAVLVIGGGISGVQAALDLATSGFKTYLVEYSPTVGGKMAQLDKTFPTNDCSTCILAPKLGDLARHPDIHLLTMCEVIRVSGQVGNFSVSLLKRPRFVDLERCTACGTCASKCPKKTVDTYNQGLSERKAIYLPYPQAVPQKYVIDASQCLYFTKGKCRVCEKVCPAQAISFSQQPEVLELQVGAIIAAPGFAPFDPLSASDTYGYGKFANVITSLQFERILSASGPYQGELRRPSDGKPPEQIAFIQCVGSRDLLCGRGYCSAVCCMAAVKEAVVAHEHLTEGVVTTIFFMDIRAQGKGYEQYVAAAKQQYDVKCLFGKVAAVEELDNCRLRLHHTNEHGQHSYHDFDLVILSVGMGLSPQADRLAAVLGLPLENNGFCRTSLSAPTATTREGILACGAFLGPRDIADSVLSAGAAACQASAHLGAQRYSLTEQRSYPEERHVSGSELRVGVFVCRCGFNIAQNVDVAEVASYARSLASVIHAEETLFACAADSCDNMVAIIVQRNLNRVVVASCTPRTHAPLFRETIRQAGLNDAYLEMANIREQCSWVHQQNPEVATTKAKALVRMAVARVSRASPLHVESVVVQPRALVIGGGLAGMRACLAVAEQGYQCFLVEKTQQLGGSLRHLRHTLEGEDPARILRTSISKIKRHPLIKTYLGAEIRSVHGQVGDFHTTIVQQAPSGGKTQVLRHGAIVVATGAREFKPDGLFFYGEDPRVVTQLELESLIAENHSLLQRVGAVVMLQCVGSRTEERPYCSRLCCNEAVKNALLLKEKYPGVEVCILHRDIRTYGLREEYYQRARELGVLFSRYQEDNPPVVRLLHDRYGAHIVVEVIEPLLGSVLSLRPDLLVLSTAIVPPATNEDLASILKIPLDADGFFLEAHAKLRPADFASEGIFLCGMAHYPKPIDEAILQAEAAALRTVSILAREKIPAGREVAQVDESRCQSCLTCLRVCPFQVPIIGNSGKATINAVACQGCGVCVAECPAAAIKMESCSDSQLLETLGALYS